MLGRRIEEEEEARHGWMLSDERFFHSLSVGVACPRLMSFSLTHGQAALVELMGVRVAQRLRSSTDRWMLDAAKVDRRAK